MRIWSSVLIQSEPGFRGANYKILAADPIALPRHYLFSTLRAWQGKSGRCVKQRLTCVKRSFTLPSINDRETMIESFKHKGLRQLFEDDTAKGVNAEHVRKLRQILGVLQAAETIDALRLPTFGLHSLKGELKGFWAVTVRVNWRLFFGSRMARHPMSTLWTITEGEKNGDEKSTPPRRADRRHTRRY
jgi:proteic killer suppression protein